MSSLDLVTTQRLASTIVDEVERAVVGKRDAVTLVLTGLLADGHVLIDDNPGVAKTLLARSLAAVTSLGFRRIQFTPDLLPADITGSTLFDPRTHEPKFLPGPLFANLILADEVNRAPAKTQSALLEAMQERQVTVDGITRPLAPPFLVIATQNPIEFEGTYPLPEAQLDRFVLRATLGYPTPDDEWELVHRRLVRATDEVGLSPVIDAPTLLEMQRAVEAVHVSEAVGRYIVALADATRQNPNLEVGASPRGTLALMKLTRVRAMLAGRDYVLPDDVKALAIPALAHRVVLRSDLWVRRIPAADVIAAIVAAVPAPSVDEL